MSNVFLLLGSNIGDRVALINNAIDLIENKTGKVLKSSLFYETEPWGFSDSKSFLNKVIIINTNLTPKVLLTELLKIELMLGRERNQMQYSSRKIDIDILFFNDFIINEELLIIPHPRLHLRMFTLIPLAEIAPSFIHPLFKKDIHTLLSECKDTGKVKPYSINIGI